MTAGPDPDAEWWTRAQVAEHLGVSPATVSGYVARKQAGMPEPTYIGRMPLWRPAVIIEWHASRPGPGNRSPRKAN